MCFVDISIGVSVSGCWLCDCMDGCFGMFMVVRWIYELMCLYVGAFWIDLCMDVSIVWWCLGGCLNGCVGNCEVVGWIYGWMCR